MLPNKYRPSDLESFAGNRTVVETVSKILERDQKDIPKAWLITGPSGTGKTTLARIIASKLGCSDLDFVELDTADFRGIETVRDLRKDSRFGSIRGGNRLWLLDECHQLTKDAQEALLKLLEEPPNKVYFVLCTTDPERLKPTLKRRCIQLQLNPLSETLIQKRMLRILKQEKKEVPDKIVERIAQDSVGSLGIALSVLDKIMDLPTDQMAKAAKQHMEEENEAIALCRALMQGKDWRTVSGLIKTIKQDPESLRRMVLGYCSAVLLNSGQAKAFVVMECFKQPFYDSPMPQLVMACYEATQG